jgi:uncharacterized protein YgfB (UPF0149 family)
MDVAPLPDFEQTLALSHGNLDEGTLAECHGVACGLLVRQPGSSTDILFKLLAMLEIVQEPGVALGEALEEMLQAAGQQLADEDMQLSIWLPEDEAPLDVRTQALAQWCNGFLASIGSGEDARLQTLSVEAGEALSDLGEIAMAEVAEGDLSTSDDREEEEQAFAEIVEYIRVSVLILREDLRGPGADDSIH